MAQQKSLSFVLNMANSSKDQRNIKEVKDVLCVVEM